MATNLKFTEDLNKFAAKLESKLSAVLQHVTTRLHGDLADATPYLTGRARASWNIGEERLDPEPAPALPFPFADEFNPTDAELAAANAFYDPIYERKHGTKLNSKTRTVFISNNVPYIEELNAGRSRQAPPLFFQATVAHMETIVKQEAERLGPS